MRIKDPKKFDEWKEKSGKLWEKQARALDRAQKSKTDKQRDKYSQQAIKAFIDDAKLIQEYFDFDENEDIERNVVEDDYDDGL